MVPGPVYRRLLRVGEGRSVGLSDGANGTGGSTVGARRHLVSVDQSPTEGLAAQSYGWSQVYRGIWKYCDKSTDRVLDGAVSQ